jgi:hypothetical protein
MGGDAPDLDPRARRQPRGYIRGMPREQQSLKITLVTQRATKAELKRFKALWVNQDHTQVWATTDDEYWAARFKHFRSYLRDSETDSWEYEVVFGEASVKNALIVLSG